MGANPTQALGLFLFLLAFTAIGAGFYSGGSVVLLILGLVGLGAALAILLRAKPLEHLES